jgi:hypothetical protein
MNLTLPDSWADTLGKLRFKCRPHQMPGVNKAAPHLDPLGLSFPTGFTSYVLPGDTGETEAAWGGPSLSQSPLFQLLLNLLYLTLSDVISVTFKNGTRPSLPLGRCSLYHRETGVTKRNGLLGWDGAESGCGRTYEMQEGI